MQVFRTDHPSAHLQLGPDIGVEVGGGVLGLAVLPDLKVEVGAGGRTGGAQSGDLIPCLHGVPLVYVHLLAGGVQGG